MTTPLGAFTTQMLNLTQNLKNMHPEDPDIQFSYDAMYIMKKTNPRKLRDMFHKYIGLQYKVQILEKNEDFLLCNDFVEDNKDNLARKNRTDYARCVINNLRKYWLKMDDESKENIWKYLQVLIVLDDKTEEASGL